MEISIKKPLLLFCLILFCKGSPAHGQKITIDRNKPERKEWFSDMGFGMMISWSIDVQLGAMISHNVAVASKDYQDQYFNELSKTFNPQNFDPGQWAQLAKLAGMKYMVFTVKHHNGFCMWNTKTTDFNIMHSGYGKDILKEIIAAFRTEGIAIGLSFSTDDFHVMYEQGLPPSRESPESASTRNSELWDTNKKQLSQLLPNYVKIDILFIDEKSDWANPLVANYAWDLDPDLVITRGSMETPEQYLPDKPLESPWEVCISMGYHWQYVGEDNYKDGGKLIKVLIETRAKGGNLLLNVGPDAHGKIPEQQENRLREIGLWYMANHEAIENVRPWQVTDENGVWFTKSRDSRYVYAFVDGYNWKWMEEKAFLFRSLSGSSKTKVSILGQNELMMEYQMYRSPKTVFSMVDEGIFVNVTKAQRLNKTWDNPLVIRFEGVEYRNERKKK